MTFEIQLQFIYYKWSIFISVLFLSSLQSNVLLYIHIYYRCSEQCQLNASRYKHRILGKKNHVAYLIIIAIDLDVLFVQSYERLLSEA